MKIGPQTQPLDRTKGLEGPSGDDLEAKLKDLDKQQLEKLLEAAQTLGPKIAMQLALQMMGVAGGGKTGDFNLSEVDGSSPRGTSSAKSNSEDLEKLLKDILKKQETAQAADGAQGSGAQGGQQQQSPPVDQYTQTAPAMSEMY